MVVIYDEAKDITPERVDECRTACGRERTRINVRIVETARPGQLVGAGAA